jgi:phosphate transport system substrate-binding protein
MDNLVLHNEEMHPDIRNNYVELTMEGMLEQVPFYHNGGLFGKPTNSYALGYTLYTYLQQMNEITGIGGHLKILSLDGVLPTAENIANGHYPLADSYYAVVRSDLPASHSARAVIAWLQSADGAASIENIGLIPCA